MMSFAQIPVCLGICPMICILPLSQHGHRLISIPVSDSIISSIDFSAVFPISGIPCSRRILVRFFLLLRFARKP